MRASVLKRLSLLLTVAVGLAGCTTGGGGSQPLPTVLTREQTAPGIGAGQGVAVAAGRVYLFGDNRPGVLREYALLADPFPRLVETGRKAALTVAGVDRINHPTGLAIRPGFPVFLGNSVTRTKEGRIYRIDLDRLFADGTADHAILNDTHDDLAVQGCRPEYVRYDGRWLLATSDYGPGPNFVRYYDPKRLATAARTSEPGVLVAKVPCGPWVQSLHFVEATGELILVQNQVEGRLWRLTVVNNPAGVTDYRTLPALDYAYRRSELEGYAQIASKLGIFVTSARRNNVTFAVIP